MHYKGLIYVIVFILYSLYMIGFAAFTYGLTLMVYGIHLFLIFYKSDAREEKVLRLYFGIDEEKIYSLVEIGQDFDV